MSRKDVQVRVCDRCPVPTAAKHSVEMCFEGVTYHLDLCDLHDSMHSREMRVWTRLGREAAHQHGPKKWVPGETFAARKRAKQLAGVGTNGYSMDLPAADGGTVYLDEPLREEPDLTQASSLSTDVVPGLESVSIHQSSKEPGSADLHATHSVRDDMDRCGLTWQQVVDAVYNAFCMAPSTKQHVTIYLSDDLSVLVADDGAVVGCAVRDREDPLPNMAEPVKKRVTRKGKRGGQGRVALTIEQIVALVRETEGWWVEDTRPHYAVHGPNGERSTIPKTNSDWRGPDNVMRDLRAIGLDLKAKLRPKAS